MPFFPTLNLQPPVTDISLLPRLKSSLWSKQDRGSLYLKVMFMPFFQPTYDDEDEDEVADGPDAAAASSVASPPGAEGEAAGAAVATASALQQAKSKRSKAKKKSAVTLPSVRQITTKVHDKLKVRLGVVVM